MRTKTIEYIVFITFFYSSSVFGQETKKRHTLKNISSKSTNKQVAQLHYPSVKNIENPDKKFRRKERGDWPIMLGGFSAVRPKYIGSDQYKINGFP